MKKIIILLTLILFLSGCVEQTTLKQYPDFNVTSNNNFNITVFEKTTNETFLISIETSPLENYTKSETFPIFFSVEDFDTQLLRHRGGAYQIIWSEGNNIWYEKGSISMNHLKQAELELELNFNEYELSKASSTSMNITFTNLHNTWTRTFPLQISIIK